jgi:hypothetical protein
MEKCRYPWLASEVLLVVVSRNQPNSRAERSLSGSRPTAVEVILIVGEGIKRVHATIRRWIRENFSCAGSTTKKECPYRFFRKKPSAHSFLF